MTPALIARVLRAAADECDRITEEASAELADWIDQSKSALGPRRHCCAVKRRVALGDGSAAIVGRRHLLSQAAFNEELARPAEKKPSELSYGDKLRAKLRLAGAD